MSTSGTPSPVTAPTTPCECRHAQPALRHHSLAVLTASLSRSCGAITDTGPGSTSTVCCHGMPGRYVTIAVPWRHEQLSLCEVEVVEQGCAATPGGERRGPRGLSLSPPGMVMGASPPPLAPAAPNAALGRPATQSSVLDATSGAANAVDGNRDGNWEEGSCAHTLEEPEPWWRVDLGGRRAVEAVVVQNRHDCCWEHLKGAEVHVGDSLLDGGRHNAV